MSVARLPELGRKPVMLTVRLAPSKGPLQVDVLSEGLKDLYRTGQLADVVLLCAEQRFLAHRLVLASQSYVLKYGLSQPAPREGMLHEIRLSDIANPEAVKIMLDYLYRVDGEEWALYNPRTQDINRDVLRLAKQFELPGLTQKAMYWLSMDLTTGSVVERLSICDEFGLEELKDKILEALTNNKYALHEVAHSPQIMTYPKLMQALLQCAASATNVPSVGSSPELPQQKSKKARKA